MDFQNWHWQQWWYVSGWALSLLIYANLHGKLPTQKYDFFMRAICIGINFYILYSGGFFK